jgi:FkbM family methyltransferase
MNIQILYGTAQQRVDVTTVCVNELKKKNIITIPNSDTLRSQYFSDPSPTTKKFVYLLKDGKEYEYDDTATIFIQVTDNTVTIKSDPNLNEVYVKLYELSNQLQVKYDTLNNKVPEQKMIIKSLKGTEKVLEIGGGVGVKSIVIASVVTPTNLVTLESNPLRCAKISENKQLNSLPFHVENSALSTRTLITQDYQTMPSEELLENTQWANTITWSDLQSKYNVDFDTLVVNCNGGFYYTLMDMPEMLTNIQLIIMTNDYDTIDQKEYVDSLLIANHFYVVYVEIGGIYVNAGCCRNKYYEIWKKAQ